MVQTFQILAHRGYWKAKEEQNTLAALLKAVELGYGIETDIRDRDGQLVISHDMPGEGALLLKDVLKELSAQPNFKEVIYALNIKTDGVEKPLMGMLADFGIAGQCFVFDVSGPCHVVFSRLKRDTGSPLMIGARVSEYEQPFKGLENQVLWVDEFEGHWATTEMLEQYAEQYKYIAIVSPELHKRDYEKEWREYLPLMRKHGNILLCTDFPDKAMKEPEEKDA